MNTTTLATEKKIGRLLQAINQPARLRILLAIGTGEACVCHLEALLGFRQAYISQHLMALRKIGLLDTRREGRFIYYRLHDLHLLDLIRMAGGVAGVSEEALDLLHPGEPLPSCCCPNCLANIKS